MTVRKGSFFQYFFPLITCFILCLSFTSSQAQKDKDFCLRRPVTLRLTYQLLHSTHRDNFAGGSFDINVNTSKHLLLGVGAQYAKRSLHYDNGWVLTRLKLLPVYLNSIYKFCAACSFQPYIHTEEGISFNRYNKLDTSVSAKPFKVSEEGLYLSGNIGMNIPVWKNFKTFTEVGYKGFKHSTNALDVNPHGFTMRIGFNYDTY